MQQAIRAGVVYFALGFALGTFRVLVLVPQLGELHSGLIELPVMLTAAWFVCRRLVNHFALEHDVLTRASMGATAFALLMLAELVLSMTLFGRSPYEHFSAYRNLHSGLGLLGQVAFALFPLLVKPTRNNAHHRLTRL